ncbi:hydantoinase/oxoprolinase family protein [Burkholderia dolosa]|jgi:N-methylhydantoinase A|uniref:hydantoinase/oxoprolinase family protein n=1 Tax=Burkholderia dolosa TaxID=152500 RepID=UPI0027D257F6|nr:hydantoinase/oxoprolinase family protein [Burkholderia dolosa]
MEDSSFSGRCRIGIDSGGTFTDMVLIDADSRRWVFKRPSVPSNPANGVLGVLEAGAAHFGMSLDQLLSRCERLIHGTTVATNLMLEGKGARVGLLCTAGFRDSLEIRRGLRPDIWDHRKPFAPVLVPRYLRIGVRGRITANGRELEALNEADVVHAARFFAEEGVDAIAVCLLHSYANAAHERRAVALLREYAGDSAAVQWISASSDIIPIIGEYERTSGTVINASLAPRMSQYLRELDERLRSHGLERPLLIQRSNGGAISIDEAVASPVNLVLSGPAAGVGALSYYTNVIESDDLIAMEVGGTSTDVMVMDGGRVSTTTETDMAGYPVCVPTVDIHTVGAGGGTIAWLDGGNMIKLGPQGAGAVPGPAAYSRGGTQPTVTDAQLVLGRLRPGAFAGGSVMLDEKLAREAIETHLSGPLGISVETAAIGIIRLADQQMHQAVERISIQRGIDVRGFVLVACGGAGPMHGVSVARSLNMSKLSVPRQSGAYCAMGMLNSDIRKEFQRSLVVRLDADAPAALRAAYDALAEQARAFLVREGFAGAAATLIHQADMRFSGQQSDISITLDGPAQSPAAMRQVFEREYERLFGYVPHNGTIEIRGARVVGCGRLQRIEPRTSETCTDEPRPVGTRRVFADQERGFVEMPVYDGPALQPGMRIVGPAIIEETTTTIVVNGDDVVRLNRFGEYIVDISRAR